jgi:hypothetical protein
MFNFKIETDHLNEISIWQMMEWKAWEVSDLLKAKVFSRRDE